MAVRIMTFCVEAQAWIIFTEMMEMMICMVMVIIVHQSWKIWIIWKGAVAMMPCLAVVVMVMNYTAEMAMIRFMVS